MKLGIAAMLVCLSYAEGSSSPSTHAWSIVVYFPSQERWEQKSNSVVPTDVLSLTHAAITEFLVVRPTIQCAAGLRAPVVS